MNYGTYTTMDAPTKKIDEALEFLRSEFDDIGGHVRKITNDHDFGGYPSFEIDYPYELEYIDIYDQRDDLTDNELELIDKKEKWIIKANDIEEKYGKKFIKYL